MLANDEENGEDSDGEDSDGEDTDSNSESNTNWKNAYYYDDGDESEINLGEYDNYSVDSQSDEEKGQDIDAEKLFAELENESVIDTKEEAVQCQTLIIANENDVPEADGENQITQTSNAGNGQDIDHSYSIVENVAECNSGNGNAVDTQSSENEENIDDVVETGTDISQPITNVKNTNLLQPLDAAVGNALDTPAPNEESSGDVYTLVKPADANVQQSGGSPVKPADANVQQSGGSPVKPADANVQQSGGGSSGTPLNLAVPHIGSTKNPAKRKTAQEPESDKNARLAWKDRGKVIFRHRWEIRSPAYINGLVRNVQRLKGDLYCKWTKTVFDRLSQTTFTVSDNKTKDDPDLVFLHLKNVDNDVAAAIRDHLAVSYDSAVVQVLKIFLVLLIYLVYTLLIQLRKFIILILILTFLNFSICCIPGNKRDWTLSASGKFLVVY